MALMSQVSAGYPRVPRDCFKPGYGLFDYPVRLRTHFLFGFLLCSQHSPCFFTDIDCCIFIPVHDASTVTAINPFGKLQLFFHVSAHAASFAGWKESVNLYQFLSLLLQLICQNIAKHPVTVIHDALSKIQTPAHGFHVKIFHSCRIVGICNLSGQLMDIVFPLIPHFLVAQCCFPLLFPVVTASFLTMR